MPATLRTSAENVQDPVDENDPSPGLWIVVPLRIACQRDPKPVFSGVSGH
jgi:hypothetical protein